MEIEYTPDIALPIIRKEIVKHLNRSSIRIRVMQLFSGIGFDERVSFTSDCISHVTSVLPEDLKRTQLPKSLKTGYDFYSYPLHTYFFRLQSFIYVYNLSRRVSFTDYGIYRPDLTPTISYFSRENIVLSEAFGDMQFIDYDICFTSKVSIFQAGTESFIRFKGEAGKVILDEFRSARMFSNV